jgi:hypothetical protein
MKVTISETMFETMLKAIKGGAAAQYISRPELEYIRIKVEGGKINVMVCDGASGARLKFDAISHDGEDFTCLIKPISFKASKNGTLPVTIEIIDGEALLDVPTAYGNLTYHFKQNVSYNDKLDGIFDKMGNHDRWVGVNATLLSRIMRNFASVSNERIKSVILESKDSKTEGFRMRMYSEKDKFEFEQFLLPIRIFNEEDE